MSSLKMTFSLASLVLILGLVFATAPAMAQVDQLHPSVLMLLQLVLSDSP